VAGFEYVGWHEDPSLPPDDEDREWCVVFLVLAASLTDAQAWGDEVSRSHAARSGDVFLHSSVEPHVCQGTLVPRQRHACTNYRGTGGELMAMAVIEHGDEAPDDFIGW
jgi:hypothetical protein